MVIEIYELTDSAGLCRYVGQSRTAKKRHRWHVQAAHRGERGRQYNWIRVLLRKGLEPGSETRR
jgi:hypothetical protein